MRRRCNEGRTAYLHFNCALRRAPDKHRRAYQSAPRLSQRSFEKAEERRGFPGIFISPLDFRAARDAVKERARHNNGRTNARLLTSCCSGIGAGAGGGTGNGEGGAVAEAVSSNDCRSTEEFLDRARGWN
jgi:hypothetical protein